jgi:hypothetical protein
MAALNVETKEGNVLGDKARQGETEWKQMQDNGCGRGTVIKQQRRNVHG